MKAKNIGLLATLALVTTVGGVYAAFTYNQGVATGDSVTTLDGQVSIAEAVTNGNKGTLKAALSDANIKFDQHEDGGNKAKLTVSGNLVVEFTAAEYAEPDVKATGINNISVTIACNTQHKTKYGETPGTDVYLFTLWGDAVASKVQEAGGTHVTKAGFKWTIPLKDMIALNGNADHTLETHTEYKAFEGIIKEAKFTITVAEA